MGSLSSVASSAIRSDTVTPSSAARACSERAGSYGPSSYGYAVEYLGARYSVSGAFTETVEGLLQLEVVTPVEAAALVADLTRAFLERN